MKQTLFIPFKYDVQVLNFYLHSYFADVKVEFNADKLSGKKTFTCSSDGDEVQISTTTPNNS
jgi:hypothetical protein